MSLVDCNFLNDSIQIRELGKGNYGSVYLIQKPNQERYAVKYMNDQTGVNKSTILDIDSLVRLRNVSDVINIVGICFESLRIGLILEAMDYDLRVFINITPFYDRIRLTEKLLNTLIRVEALMETLNIVHFDVKPQNILVSSNNLETKFKVTDFGLAEPSFGSNIIPSSEFYTLWYRPPEFLLNKDRKTFRIFAGDIWAIGVTVIEFITGIPVFPALDVNNMLQLIYYTVNPGVNQFMFNTYIYNGTISGTVPITNLMVPEIYYHLDPNIIIMLSRMLALNPNHRPTGVQLLGEFNEKIDPNFLISLVPPVYPRRIDNNSISIIIDISKRLNLTKASTLIAIEIFTRYFNILDIDTNINIRCICCLIIAQKYVENIPVENSKILNTCGAMCLTVNISQILTIEKEILEKINFQIYNLNLGPVIERAYSMNIDLSKVDINQFVQPLSNWLVD
jgi:serine/threonine protein kinase